MKTKKTFISVISVFMAMLMVLLNFSLPVGALTDEIVADDIAKPIINPEDKIDATLKEKMETASPDEKIPVAIWFEDIDKETLEAEVEKTCGISKEVAFDVQNDAESDARLLRAVEDKDETALKSYVEDKIDTSKEQRRIKELYKNTLLDVSADFYTEHNENIVSSAKIPEEDITFLSRLTPFMIAEVDSSKLVELSADDSVLSIGYYSENVETVPSENTRDANTDAMNFDKSFEKFGLTGEGVTVLQIEGGYVRSDIVEFDNIPYPENINLVINTDLYSPTDVNEIPYQANPTSHANYVARRLQEVASDVHIYSVRDVMYEDIEWAIENCDIDLINASADMGAGNYDDEYVAQWYDALISAYSISLVASAGNTYEQHKNNWPIVLTPSSGYNSISVGVYKVDTGMMKDYRYNPADNADVVRYKPDVIAAAPDTSTAAPFVSGIVALMAQLDYTVAVNPALVKAILMASCHEKALPYSSADVQENMFDGLTLKQGAGKVDAYKALSIVLMGTYSTGRVSPSASNTIDLSFPNDTNVNVSLVWLRRNIFPYEEGPGTVGSVNTTVVPLQELSLSVVNNGNVLKTSNVTNSGKQLVYFSADEDTEYDVRITKTASNNTFTVYACAWSASNQKELTSAQINGKMAKGQQISATAQCNDGTTAGTNEVNYQWQTSADGNTWVNIVGAVSGSYTLTSQEFNKYIRCIITPKSNSGILPLAIIAESDLKVIVYGDSDLSGNVNSKDVTAVQKYVAGRINFTDDQKRAADVNGDGIVTDQDSTLIQNYLAGIISEFPVE